ncbi:MAG TPA: hypothetical protein VMW29_01640 [Candidatus Bathyarchaeia archaeon]|nr:hypothetical protein [Candidatus Bathyarchaeia archaeon]
MVIEPTPSPDQRAPQAAVSPRPEIIAYFGDQKLDADIAETGWTITGDNFGRGKEIIPFERPKNLRAVEIEPFDFPGGRLANYACFDPGKAEVKELNWREQGRDAASQLIKEGYQLIASNMIRGVFIRTIPQPK